MFLMLEELIIKMQKSQKDGKLRLKNENKRKIACESRESCNTNSFFK